MQGETYWDIVWKQFRKNRLAYVCLWLLAALFLLAIFAPLIVSNQPFSFWDGEKTLYPWWRALFNPENTIDFIFNMALLGFLPWGALCFWRNRAWRRLGLDGRRRAGRMVAWYVGVIVLLCLVFGALGLKPANSYWARTFTEEQHASDGEKHGTYTLIPFGATEQDRPSRYKPPLYQKPESEWRESNDGFVHFLGTDDTGRDAVALMLYGLRISLTVGFVAVSLYLTIGIIIGALAGYFGGKVDIVLSRLVEVVMLFPTFFLILTLVALIGPSIYVIMVVIGITGWPGVARLIRGEVLKQRSMEYVAAARALGASHLRVIFRHILPNALSPALVAAPFGVAGAIMVEGGLSLLGFGVRPPTPSWGTMLNLASSNYGNWWLVLFPSLAIFVSVTMFNLIGNGLRDAMDPRMRM